MFYKNSFHSQNFPRKTNQYATKYRKIIQKRLIRDLLLPATIYPPGFLYKKQWPPHNLTDSKTSVLSADFIYMLNKLVCCVWDEVVQFMRELYDSLALVPGPFRNLNKSRIIYLFGTFSLAWK